MKPTTRQALVDELGTGTYDDLIAASDYEAIAAALTDRPMIANPDPQPNVPMITIRDVFGDLSPQEAYNLYMIPNFRRDVENALIDGDMVSLGDYLLIAIGSGKVSPGSQGKLQSRLQNPPMVPDPNWPAQVPGQSRADALGLSIVTAAMIQEILNP